MGKFKITPQQQIDFINEIAPLAQAAYKTLGKVLPSVCIGMACVESGFGWGTDGTRLMYKHNAILGYKVGSGKTATKYWSGKAYKATTKEEYQVGVHTVVPAEAFREYDSLAQCILNYYELLNTSLYKRVTANVDYDLFRYLTLGATTRIPLVPSKLPMSAGINFKESYEVDLMDLLTEEDKPDPENGGGKKNDDLLTDPVILSKPYAVHRPFKLGASVDFHPNGTLLSTYGYLGLGVRHPFAKQKSETQAYIDYTVGGKLSLWNMFTIDLCHSYNDEVFKNTKIESFYFSDGMSEIPENLFSEKSSVKKIGFAKNSTIHTISKRAFYQTEITRVNIPASVHAIGSEAFYTETLRIVRFNSIIPPTDIALDAFNLTIVEEVIVPKGSLKLYKAALEGTELKRIIPLLKEAE